MDRKTYIKSFEGVKVSEKAEEKVLAEADRMQSEKSYRRRNKLKVLIPLAALLSLSLITVSAAQFSGVSDLFKDYFRELFPNSSTDYEEDQSKYLEVNGESCLPDFIKNGVTMSIDGIIGDRDFLFLRYSVAKDETYDNSTFCSFLTPSIYLGQMSKDNLPSGCYTDTDMQTGDPSRTGVGLLVYSDKGVTMSGQEVTLVMKNYSNYVRANINLAKVFDEYGADPVNNSDNPYDVPKLDLNIPFGNEYGGSLRLDSIGFVNDKLVLAVDTSDYYKIPEILLRNNSTGEILHRCDGLVTATLDGVEFWPYAVGGVEALKELEIIIPEEYHFTFPLTYTDNTKDLDLNGQASMMLGGITIDSIRISPLSLVIEGKADEYGNRILAYQNCSIRLKDNTVLKYSEKGYCNTNDEGFFKTGVPFGEPVMLDSIESLLIETGTDSVELDVN